MRSLQTHIFFRFSSIYAARPLIRSFYASKEDQSAACDFYSQIDMANDTYYLNKMYGSIFQER